MELVWDIYRVNGLIIRTDASELTAMDLNPNWEFTIISINWLLWLANHLIRKAILNTEPFWNSFYNYMIFLGTFCLDFRLITCHLCGFQESCIIMNVPQSILTFF